MDMKRILEPSANRRQLGRSRVYAYGDLPSRLHHWHAPRANRWEYLCVTVGPLEIQWLGAEGIRADTLGTGDARWIAPGMRWRVTRMQTQSRFQLEIHADDATAASAPQPVRAALLDEADEITLTGPDALEPALSNLAPRERCLLRARFDIAPHMQDRIARGAGDLCWHPLERGEARCSALLARAAEPIGLLEYLGRDHAVIEAALAGALRGDVERELWLRNTLARHLVIEEEILFPAYLEAGGNPGWVRGLCNEHKHLRRDLDRLSDPVSQRRFLLLLDGHDEKEEQTVYPDILSRLGADDDVLQRIMTLGLPATSDSGASA